MQKAVVFALLLLFTISVTVHAQNQTLQASRAHHMMGLCRSFGAAGALKASVFIIIKQGWIKLTNCREDGIFSALVPQTATHLNLELDSQQRVSKSRCNVSEPARGAR